MTAAAVSLAAVPYRAPVNKWMVTLSVTFGTLMGAIDTSIVAVATPHLSGSLGATVEEMTWVTTGFVIATVVVMPLTAFLGRFFGQKRVYLPRSALFVLGSALCGLARSLPAMVVVPRPAGAGGRARCSRRSRRSCARRSRPRSRAWRWRCSGWRSWWDRRWARRWAATCSTTTPGPGSSTSTCRSGLLGIFMVTRFVHEPEDIRRANHARAADQRKNLDWQGIVLMTVGLASLQYVLEEGSAQRLVRVARSSRSRPSWRCSCWRPS